MQHFEYSSWIDAPVSVVFAFHERPDAFEKLAPPGQKIQILHRKGGLETGARIEFLTRVGPIPVRWLALHVEYEKDRFFLDEQIRGPFKKWYHRHEFEEERGGTRLTDSIRFSLPGGWPADLLFSPVVKYKLRGMFRNRHEVTKRECEQPLAL